MMEILFLEVSLNLYERGTEEAPVAVMAQGLLSYGGIRLMKVKEVSLKTEKFKHILLQACQRGELSTHMTAKEMVQELAQQLKQVCKGNES